MQIERKSWFTNWLNKKESPSLNQILDFHHTAGAGNKDLGLLMQRGDILKTISITSIESNTKELNLIYENLIDQEIAKYKLKIKREKFLV